MVVSTEDRLISITSPRDMSTAVSPSKTATCSPSPPSRISIRTVSSADSTMLRMFRVWEQMEVRIMIRQLGAAMGPPAERL